MLNVNVMDRVALYEGIDVSDWQDKIDWTRVPKSIKFAMIRAGFGNDISQVDHQFYANIEGALANDFMVGIYWMSYAISVEDAIKEAKVCKQLISKYSDRIKFPVCFDWEYDSIRYYVQQTGQQPTKQLISAMTVAFCKEMTSGGWFAGNYINIDFTKNHTDPNNSEFWELPSWLADYTGGPDYPCMMQQTASDGHVDGINTHVDKCVVYIDIPALIASLHLNGLGGTAPAPTPVPTPAPVSTEPVQTEYVVQSGDTLSGIADQFHTTYQILAEINGISNPNLINVGQVIKLVGTAVQPSAPTYATYVVQSGDTLSGIANQFHTTYQMLAKINGISDPNLINVGQVIKLVGATAQPVQQTQRTYTVKSGDTLWSISSEFLGDGSRYVELMHTNGMSSTTIYPGDVLKLPN